ncbi:MAG: antitoxin [Pseudonocardia sp.]|nr:antitoxin [Pseudonocardia sp.]
MRKLAVLGIVAGAARQYAQNNPEQVRVLAEKAAQFVDGRTKGKYTRQIKTVQLKLTEILGASETGYPSAAPTRPTPHPRG